MDNSLYSSPTGDLNEWSTFYIYIHKDGRKFVLADPSVNFKWHRLWLVVIFFYMFNGLLSPPRDPIVTYFLQIQECTYVDSILVGSWRDFSQLIISNIPRRMKIGDDWISQQSLHWAFDLHSSRLFFKYIVRCMSIYIPDDLLFFSNHFYFILCF